MDCCSTSNQEGTAHHVLLQTQPDALPGVCILLTGYLFRHPVVRHSGFVSFVVWIVLICIIIKLLLRVCL